MKTKQLLFYMLAGLLGGCFPVMSLHPLYTEEDVAFEENLVGTWVDDPNGPETTWEFSRAGPKEKVYKLVFSDKDGKKGSFDVHLVKLKERFFLDVYPSELPWKPEDPNKVKWLYNSLFLIPAHTFLKIDSIESQLKMRLTDDEELKEQVLWEDPNAVKHMSIESRIILTASTKELQAFVLKHADDNRVFTGEIVLNRKKSKNPNSPSNIGP